MYRIKDPKASLEFYTGVLGMRLLKKLDFPAMTFSLYFLGFESEDDIPKDEKVKNNVKYFLRYSCIFSVYSLIKILHL